MSVVQMPTESHGPKIGSQFGFYLNNKCYHHSKTASPLTWSLSGVNSGLSVCKLPSGWPNHSLRGRKIRGHDYSKSIPPARSQWEPSHREPSGVNRTSITCTKMYRQWRKSRTQCWTHKPHRDKYTHPVKENKNSNHLFHLNRERLKEEGAGGVIKTQTAVTGEVGARREGGRKGGGAFPGETW